MDENISLLFIVLCSVYKMVGRNTSADGAVRNTDLLLIVGDVLRCNIVHFIFQILSNLYLPRYIFNWINIIYVEESNHYVCNVTNGVSLFNVMCSFYPHRHLTGKTARGSGQHGPPQEAGCYTSSAAIIWLRSRLLSLRWEGPASSWEQVISFFTAAFALWNSFPP